MKKRWWAIGCTSAAAVILISAVLFSYLVLRPLIYGPSLSKQPPFPLHRVWTQSLGNNIQHLTVDGESNMLLAKTSNSLSALDAISGTVLWRTPVGSQVVPRAAVVAAGRTFVADRDTLWSIDLKTGAVLWRQRLENESTWVTDASDSIVLVDAVSEYLAAYDARTGHMLWKVDVGRGYRPAYTDQGKVYLVDDAITALDENSGRILWHADYPAASYGIHARGVIYFTANQSTREFEVIAFDLDHGGELWSQTFLTSGSEHLGLHGNTLFVLNDFSISAVSAKTGERMWTHKLGTASHPNVIGNEVYVIEDFYGVIQSLELDSGQLSGALRVAAPKPLYVYKDNLASLGNTLFSAQGKSLSAYSP